MSKLYDRAEIYDLIDSEKRIEITRKDWKQFLGELLFTGRADKKNDMPKS